MIILGNKLRVGMKIIPAAYVCATGWVIRTDNQNVQIKCAITGNIYNISKKEMFKVDTRITKLLKV